ncbi:MULTISPECIES: glycosyltransferase family 2 protein [unclassified Vibrio]|uniref:glycosyltransferase family 2 protein n=1 Tax=unclassified Vibrio TaxID=2614977 RepID=UPI00354EB208
MKAFISVVSHGHGKLISNIDTLSTLSEHFTVVVKNNVHDQEIERYVKDSKIVFINDEDLYSKGFGENNNIVFNFCQEYLGLGENDYFLVLNPDVVIDVDSITNLLETMASDKLDLGAINLYVDKSMTKFDPSVRRFPSFLTFVRSIIGLGNDSILDKSLLPPISTVDWAAGSFLCFRAGHYEKLRGFDTKYFMYCEDIDICYRSFKLSSPVTFFRDIKAVHFAQSSNRKVFSRHFYWHLKGSFRFLFKARFY